MIYVLWGSPAHSCAPGLPPYLSRCGSWNPEKTLSTGLYKTLKADRGRAAALRKIKLRMIRGAEDQTYRYSCS